jgi:hypothetical protein
MAAAYLHTCFIWHPRDEEQLGPLRAIEGVVSEGIERIAALGVWERRYKFFVIHAGCALLVNRCCAGARVDPEGNK